MAQGTLHRGLHDVFGIVVRSRQHGREATQPRQQLDQLAPELRHVLNLSPTDNDRVAGLFPPTGSFCSVQLMGRPVQTFRQAALFAVLALLAVTAWSHEENEPRDRETRVER